MEEHRERIEKIIRDTGLPPNQILRLDLSHTGISVLPEGIFQDLTNLQKLYLDGNLIEVLPEGIFRDLTNLQELYLSGKQIKVLPKGIFRNLTNLQILFLYANRIEVLPEGIFRDLTNLQTLNLANNRIEVLPDGIFRDLTNLQGLYLNDNQLNLDNINSCIGLRDLLGCNQLKVLALGNEGDFQELSGNQEIKDFIYKMFSNIQGKGIKAIR